MCPFMGLNTFQNVVISNQSGPYIKRKSQNWLAPDDDHFQFQAYIRIIQTKWWYLFSIGHFWHSASIDCGGREDKMELRWSSRFCFYSSGLSKSLNWKKLLNGGFQNFSTQKKNLTSCPLTKKHAQCFLWNSNLLAKHSI